MTLIRRALKIFSSVLIAFGFALIAVGSSLYLMINDGENYSAGRTAWMPFSLGTIIAFIGSRIGKKLKNKPSEPLTLEKRTKAKM